MIQIIVGAILLGMMCFLVVVVFLVPQPQVIPQPPMLSYVGLGLAVAALPAAFVIPRIIRATAFNALTQQQPDDGADANALFGSYMTSTIVNGAILEGPVFMNTIAYMQERQPFSLLVAGGLIILVMTLTPKLSRAEGWLNEQLQRLNDERSRQLA